MFAPLELAQRKSESDVTNIFDLIIWQNWLYKIPPKKLLQKPKR